MSTVAPTGVLSDSWWVIFLRGGDTSIVAKLEDADVNAVYSKVLNMSTFRVKRTGKSKRSLRGPEEEREYGTSSSGLLCDRDINVRRDSIIGKSLATRASVMRQRNQAYLISYANVPAMSLYDIVEEQIKADNKVTGYYWLVLILLTLCNSNTVLIGLVFR